MLLSQYKPLAQKAYCAAIVLLLILSEVFSSNIQAALPTFSSLTRLALTGGAVALLGVKIFLLTDYEARWQPILAALVLALYWGATLLYLPATILTILAFGFWLPVTIALMIVYPGLEKVFKLEETINARRAAEIEDRMAQNQPKFDQ